MALVLVFLVLVVFQYTKIITYHSKTAIIPDISQTPIKEAISKLEELDLNYKIIDSSIYNKDFKEKLVISTHPQAGELVKKYRTVYITVNKLILKEVLVPNIIGKSKRKVMYILDTSEIKTNIIYVYGDEKDILLRLIHKGQVISSDTNIYINKNSKIDLIFSNGLKQGEVYLPNLDKKSLQNAKRIINSSGLKLVNIKYTNTIDSSKAVVYRQYPTYSKDKKVQKLSEISIWLSDSHIYEY